MKIEVIGSNGDTNTFFCGDIARRIGKPNAIEEGKEEKSAETQNDTPVFDVDVVFNSYLEIDYIKKIKALQKENGGAYHHHTTTHLVIVDGEYMGDITQFGKWAVDNKYIDEIGEANQVVHNRLAREEFTQCIADRGGKRVVFLEFADGSPHVDQTTPDYGKIVIELFDNVVPKATENFFKLCTGELGATEVAKLHYLNCPVHRVVAGGWMQCGDIVAGDGSGSYAAVGNEGKVQDESFVFDFGGPLPGMVGYSTSASHSIGSQFFITLGPCGWMNGSYEGVGQVVQGFHTLQKVERCKVNNQIPDPSILVSKAGKYIA